MHREFVHVHLGEHGIQMHERPGAGDFKSQHRVDLGALVGEDGRCQLLDGLRLSPLGDTHSQHPAAQVQDVPALDPEILVRRIVQRHLPGVVRMMPQHIVAVQGLPVAGGREHMVQAHAPADAGEGVPGEIQVGDRRHQEPGPGVHQAGQPSLLVGEHILIRHALHGFQHQLQGVLDIQQIPLQVAPVSHGGAAGPADGLLHKPAAQLLVSCQHLGRQVLQIDHLRPVVPQDLGKAVVLPLSAVQIGNIVKQQLAHGIGAQMLQLPARPLQKHPLQRADLAFNANGHGISSSPVPPYFTRFPARFLTLTRPDFCILTDVLSRYFDTLL